MKKTLWIGCVTAIGIIAVNGIKLQGKVNNDLTLANIEALTKTENDCSGTQFKCVSPYDEICCEDSLLKIMGTREEIQKK